MTVDEKKMTPASDADLEKVTGGKLNLETGIFTCTACRRIYKPGELIAGTVNCPVCGTKLVKGGLSGKPK